MEYSVYTVDVKNANYVTYCQFNLCNAEFHKIRTSITGIQTDNYFIQYKFIL